MTHKDTIKENIIDIYKPLSKDTVIIQKVYKEYQFIRDEVMNRKYGEMNDRTPLQFWNDSQKRANAYVPSRENQGKKDWQANVFTQYTRNKIKVQIASITRDIPRIKLSARNERNEIDIQRGEIMEKLVEASYLDSDMMPQETIFFDGWDGCINGTVIKHDSYLRTKAKIKTIQNHDLTTGEITVLEEEKEIEDKPIEVPVNLEHFFIKDPYILDVQKQPEIIWVQYLNREQFDFEFRSYKNYKYVKAGESVSQGEMDLFFGEQWNHRVEKNKIEIVRYYNKIKDEYIIIANGVLLLNVPLLWGKKRKYYPFAKTIYEPFAKSTFFWGNSLPNILMGNQDIANAFINSMVDKTYRTLVPPMLIGIQNRDAFDLEDEYVGIDTKIYVDDVSQVTPMPVPSVNQSEFNMMQMITKGIDEASTDSVQSGYGGSGSTAREIVLANQRAEELKGLFFMFLSALWIQKVRLRTINILMNYNRPMKIEAVIGKEDTGTFYEQYKNFNINNGNLSSGEIGALQIGVVGTQAELDKMNVPLGFDKNNRSYNEIDVREEASRINGQPLEIIMIRSDYLDNWEYFINIETETFFQSKKALDKAQAIEKMTTVAQLFPDIFIANKKEFFRDFMMRYDDNPDKYLRNMEQNAAVNMPMMQSKQVTPVTNQITEPTKTLPKLTGAEIV